MENNKFDRTINGYTITYYEENGINCPDLALSEQSHYSIGKTVKRDLTFEEASKGHIQHARRRVPFE